MNNIKGNITPGTILLTEKPFVYCLSSKVRTECCDYCFKKGMLLKCTACQYVHYCGKACQKEGWFFHKAECKSLKKIAPRIIPDAARMLARMIFKLKKNGNLVRSYYTEMNFRMYRDLMSHYPNMKNDTKRMEHFQSLSIVLEEFMSGEILPNPVDLMGMFGRTVEPYHIKQHKPVILTLCIDKTQRDPEMPKAFYFQTSPPSGMIYIDPIRLLAYSYFLIFKVCDEGPSQIYLRKLIGQILMCINSFNICSEEQQILGTGIYLGASILDHSCEPNAVGIFEGTTIHIRALKPMPYLNWSEVFISYIDVLNTTKNRIEDLQRVYYFTCKCQKCLAPDPVEMLAAACPNSNCDNAISCIETESCPKCKEHISKVFWNKFQEVTELTDLHLQNMKELAYLDACRICLEKQTGVLHKFNIKYVKTLDLTFESCICFGKFEEAIVIGKQLVEPFYKYYGKFHPLTGLLHLKLGKILMHLDNMSESLKFVKIAYEILKITHGTQSEVFREELLPLLRQC